MKSANIPLTAIVRQAVPTRDGAWSLFVKIEGSKITALVRSPQEAKEGARVRVIGSGSSWSLAA